VSLSFPYDFPFSPPVFKFRTPIYHPNIDDKGEICLGILKQGAWKPATRLPTILDAIIGLLVTPNPDDPLVASIADVFTNDRYDPVLRGGDCRKGFERMAREQTKKFAI
jgi:ubiquitin-conjugating enzyme E2 D